MECLDFISSDSYGFFSSSFPGTTRGLYLFSGTYLNKLRVSIVPSDRIAPFKGSIRVGASLPEDGSSVGFRNVAFYFVR